jgi:hypothetical protein
MPSAKKGACNIMKYILTIFAAAALYVFGAYAQTGTWSGKLDVQGTKLSLVFHLDDENPTMDSPDQGVKGIPIQIEREGFGALHITIPSLAASYEGKFMIKQIVGTFSQMGLSLPLILSPGEEKLKRPQTPQGPFPYTTEEVTFMNGDSMPNIEKHDLPLALKQNLRAVQHQIQMPYMKHFLALDMRPLLSRITCPVLALNGTKDIQVEHGTNLSALRNGLPANEKNSIESIDGVNHLFQHCNTGAVSEYREIEETISPAVIEIIIEWIHCLLPDGSKS